MNLKRVFLIVLVCVMLPVTVFSFTTMKGYYIAQEECPALESIRKGTNPGNVMLKKGMSYPLLAKNKPNPTYYMVKVEGAKPDQRWVPATGGKIIVDCKVIVHKKLSPKGAPKQPGDGEPEYLFAVSWQSAFCETHPTKAECESQTPKRYDATHLTLHGLWPQPRGTEYCGVSSKNIGLDKHHSWSQLPKVNMSEATFHSLLEVMPGVASYLQRHEWYKHGVCYGAPPDIYFGDAIHLVHQINESAVQQFFMDNIGKTVSSKDILAKFDEAFGKGASSKVKINCGKVYGKTMVVAMYLNLKGKIEADTKLADLLKNSAAAGKGCDTVYIDPVGHNH